LAKKGQKFKRYSNAQREEILEKHIRGIPSPRLAEEYGIPEKTIRNWKRKFINYPELYPGLGQKRGRIKESDLTKEDYKERYEILKKYQAFLKAQREKK
jgi:transposase-like protein